MHSAQLVEGGSGTGDSPQPALVRPVCNLRAALHARVAERHAVAARDNETVYFQAVPASNELPVLDAKQLAKAIAFEAPARGADVFAHLVPAAQAETARACAARLAEHVAARARAAGDATAAVRGALTTMDLPACVDALDAGASAASASSVPAELGAALAAARAKGGYTYLADRWRALQELSAHVTATAEGVRAQLKREADEDATYRDRFGARWARARSADLTAQFTADAMRVDEYLAAAAPANATLAREMHEHSTAMQRALGMDAQVRCWRCVCK